MILYSREKIVMLRKEYDITQKELGQNEFSQSYIASLENGQRELNAEILKFICNSFNEIFVERNIEKKITLEWLSRSFEQEKNIVLGEYLLKIKTSNNEEDLKGIFIGLEAVKEQITNEEKANLFHNLAYKFMLFGNNNLAYDVYNSIFFIFNEISDYKLLGKIMNNFLVIIKKIKVFSRFKNIVDLFENRESVLEKNIKVYIVDSLIEISYYLGDYEKEFDFLKSLEELTSYKKGKILTINRLQLLVDNNKLNDAKKLYKKINEDDFFIKYKDNLDLVAIELFRKLDKKAEVKCLYQNFICQNREFLEAQKNLILAKIAIYLKQKDDAIRFYEGYVHGIFSEEINLRNRYELYEAIKYLLGNYKKIHIDKVERIFMKFLEFDTDKSDYSLAFLLLEYFVDKKFYEKYFLYNEMIIKRIEDAYVKYEQ